MIYMYTVHLRATVWNGTVVKEILYTVSHALLRHGWGGGGGGRGGRLTRMTGRSLQ